MSTGVIVHTQPTHVLPLTRPQLTKWLGKPSLVPLIAKLKDADKKTIEKKIAKIKPPDPKKLKPTKTLRTPVPEPEGMTRDKDGNVIVDLIEPTDLLKELKATKYVARASVCAREARKEARTNHPFAHNNLPPPPARPHTRARP